MKKTFTKQEVRDLLNKVIMDEVSFTRMVEIMNERVSERVNEAERHELEHCNKQQNKMKAKVTVAEIRDLLNQVYRGEISFSRMVEMVNEAEDIPEKPKKGDLAIFWDVDKGWAFVGKYNGLLGNGSSFPHQDHRGNVWANAIKFESKEQYERLIRGEI